MPKDRHMDQWNRNESSQINPHNYSQFFWQGYQDNSMEK